MNQCAFIDCILEAEVQHDMMLYKYLNQIRERKMLVNTFFFSSWYWYQVHNPIVSLKRVTKTL